MLKDEREAGRTEGKAEEKAETVLEFLRELGVVPEELEKRIVNEKDLAVLTKWVKLAAKSGTIEEFVDGM